jgi:hypothetical protein
MSRSSARAEVSVELVCVCAAERRGFLLEPSRNETRPSARWCETSSRAVTPRISSAVNTTSRTTTLSARDRTATAAGGACTTGVFFRKASRTARTSCSYVILSGPTASVIASVRPSAVSRSPASWSRPSPSCARPRQPRSCSGLRSATNPVPRKGEAAPAGTPAGSSRRHRLARLTAEREPRASPPLVRVRRRA